MAWLNDSNSEPDIVLLPHSLLRCPLDRPYRAIRLIRDPRDIWVSGYLYHLRCDEGWCRNIPMDSTFPIRWPQVDYSIEHRPEDWKRRYLERLNGQSYQKNLLDRTGRDGLDFELEGYTGWTLASMREWVMNGADALDVRLEHLMADFDGAMVNVFAHFGFSVDQSQIALEVARSEDPRRMDDAAIAERPQILSRTISKWRDVLSAAQISRFEERYGDLIRDLGYEMAGAATPAVADDEIRLSADGVCVRPSAAERGSYSFVVPSGRQRVRLESRSAIQIDPHASPPGAIYRLGVRVREITIRSSANEVVIAADDPRLIVGWHGAKCDGSALWRWTDGSADLPWASGSGAAVVIIRCMTLSEYKVHHGFGEHGGSIL